MTTKGFFTFTWERVCLLALNWLNPYFKSCLVSKKFKEKCEWKKTKIKYNWEIILIGYFINKIIVNKLF